MKLVPRLTVAEEVAAAAVEVIRGEVVVAAAVAEVADTAAVVAVADTAAVVAADTAAVAAAGKNLEEALLTETDDYPARIP